MANAVKIKVSKNGPYLVSGGIPLMREMIASDMDGNSVDWHSGKQYPIQQDYSLCRCGRSAGKPFCDTSHLRGFDGTEKDSGKPYASRAFKISGATMDLSDAKEFCSAARFCHNKHGRIWDLIKDSKNDAIVRKQAFNCPSGRLVLWDKYGKPMEPSLNPSISVTEDPKKHVSGPLWVRGCVEIESASGKKYEIRNRVTLCRCGKSTNKPFCDGSHIDAGFNDGDESLK
jgi:CDGSH-type Zn-finger protein